MPKKGFTKVETSKKELLYLYKDCNLSHAQIASKTGSSRGSIQRLFKKYGMKSRTNAESQTAINITRTPNLNEQQKQLIYGSLLGDACLHRSIMRSNKTGREIEIYKLFFYHSAKHIGYVEHKADLLGIGVKTKKQCKLSTRISGHGSTMKGFAFSHTPLLREMSKDFLDKKYRKRITKEWLDKINYQGLAYWYMDDGCLPLDRKKQKATITFYTQSFSLNEIKMLINLLGRLGFRATKAKDPNGSSGSYIIKINHQEDVFDFLRKTEKFIVPCMDYKNRILRDNWEIISEYNNL